MSKYPNKYEIPEQFPEILSNFTREIVRNQPKDILDFAIKYFYNLEKKMMPYSSINSNKYSTINSELNINQSEIMSSNNEQSDTDIIKNNNNKTNQRMKTENSKSNIDHNESNKSEEYENNFINDSRENELIVPISKNLEDLIKKKEKEEEENTQKEENKNKDIDEYFSESSEISGNDSQKQEVKDFISCLF